MADRSDSILVYDLDDKIGLCQQEASFQLVDALLHNLNGGLLGTVFQVFLVHYREAKARSVSLAPVLDLGQGRQVVHPVERSTVLGIVSTQQQIDLIGSSTQGIGQLFASKIRLRVDTQLSAIVGQFVQL